jgi:hypothetical protein
METDRSATLSLIAGLAWIGAALCFGYLAFLQLQYAPLDVGSSSNLRGLALANGIGAGVFAIFGAGLILGASRGTLLASAIWAGINVAYAAWQVSTGVTADVFLLGTALAGIAGVLSFVAWRQAPGDGSGLSGGAKVLLAMIGIATAVGAYGLLVSR